MVLGGGFDILLQNLLYNYYICIYDVGKAVVLLFVFNLKTCENVAGASIVLLIINEGSSHSLKEPTPG